MKVLMIIIYCAMQTSIDTRITCETDKLILPTMEECIHHKLTKTDINVQVKCIKQTDT